MSAAVCIGPPASPSPHGAPLRVRAVLEPRGPAAALILSDEQVEAIAPGKRTPPVRVTVNGHTFQGRVGRMRGETLLGFNRAVRAACGVEPGDEIDAEIVLDDGPRDVDVPPELTAALADDAAAQAAFAALAHTHRKEFARWIAEAKRPETRERRLAETLARLHEGRTRS